LTQSNGDDPTPWLACAHGILDAHRRRQHSDDYMTGEIVRVGFGYARQRGRRNDNDPFDGKADPPLLQPPRRTKQAAAD